MDGTKKRATYHESYGIQVQMSDNDSDRSFWTEEYLEVKVGFWRTQEANTEERNVCFCTEYLSARTSHEEGQARIKQITQKQIKQNFNQIRMPIQSHVPSRSAHVCMKLMRAEPQTNQEVNNNFVAHLQKPRIEGHPVQSRQKYT